MRATKLKPPTLIKIKGATFWRVVAPAPGGGRIRRTFKDRQDAVIFHERSKVQIQQFGEASMIDDRTRTDAVKASEILAGTGKSLVDAASFLRDALERASTGKPVVDAVTAFLADRADMSNDYIATLKPRLELFAEWAGKRTTSQMTSEDIGQFLGTLELAPRTVAHYRAHLVALFNFCAGRKWATENPAEGVTIPKASDPEPEILSPGEAAALLSVCDAEILPGVAISLFCGLRQAEVEKLDWSAVNLAQGIVTIGAKIAKTNSRRVVTIPPNAVQWLTPHAKKKGMIWPDEVKARELWTLARVRAGYGPFFAVSNAVRDAMIDPATGNTRDDLKPWPANALRHSAISYRVARDRDLAKIAYESGNSPAVIQRHYNGLASPKDAGHFFEIKPEVSENITTFKAA